MELGIFKDSIKKYHENEAVGSTSVKQMAISRKHFYIAWKGWDKKESKAFDEGQAVHSVLLENNAELFVPKPEGVDRRSKEGKKILDDLELNGKIILDKKIYDSLFERQKVFMNCVEARKVFDGAQIEMSHYTRDANTKLFLKARPDMINGSVIGDLKTTGNMQFFEKDIFRYGYHIQAGFYSLVCEKLREQRIQEFKFIAQEKTPPYGVKVFSFGKTELDLCRSKALDLLNRVSSAIQENKFPIYDDIVIDVKFPKWLEKQDSFFEEEEL